jgi:Zc3h12a-like Ribonuclease NYN domain/S1 RNA binding domain
MTAYKVVVDGSNIATEGRSLPSLNQLDEAVQAFVEEHPGADVLVIVDTSFAHRVDPSEAQVFEAAYDAGEIITPPAGTIGRGDSFILKVADKLGATVFSNDSFQEFHGTYDWLFERGRLIGGKPVPGLGWVFMDRTPVRGPKSREAVRDARRSQARIGSKEAMRPMPVPKAPPAFVGKKAEPLATVATGKGRGRGKAAVAPEVAPRDAAPRDAAPREAREGRDGGRRRGRRDRGRGAGRGESAANTTAVESTAVVTSNARDRDPRRSGSTEPVNESLAFITFVAAHGIGTEVDGEIESYSSHGFYVSVAGARGYTPLLGLAEPMPRSAKEVVRKGETRTFVVASFDAERRGIQLALVGTPSAALVPKAESSGKGRGAKKAKAASTPTPAPAASSKKVTTKKAAAPKKAIATKKAATKAAAAKTVEAPKKATPSTKVVAPKKVAPSKKVVPTKEVGATKKVASPKKAPAPQKAPAIKTAAPAPKKPTKVAKTATKKANPSPVVTSAKKTAAKKVAAPTKAATAPKKAVAKAPAKKKA